MLKVSIDQTETEELLNTITHGLGLLISIVGSAFMIYFALKSQNPWYIAGSIIFSTTEIVLYLCSTLYHHTKDKYLKDLFSMLDHSAIYFFIAGSYTLILFIVMRNSTGLFVIVSQWAIAIAGTIYKFRKGAEPSIVSSLGYLAMGWMICLFYNEVMDMPTEAFYYLLAGGLFYTFGIIFFLLDHKYHFFHTIWHLFVMGGTLMHYLLAMNYIVN